MRMILEKALIALLNQEKEKADALFHDFILERSRQIHESLRQGEDFVLDESIEETMSIDEMFGDDDLAEDDMADEGDGDVVAEEGEDEFAAGDDVAADAGAGDELSADDVDAGDDAEEGEGEEEELPLEDRVTDLEADLQRLSAEFDALMGDEGLEGDELDAEEEETVEEAVVQISTTDTGEINVVASTDDEEGDNMGFDAAPADDMGFDAAPADDMGADDLGSDDFDDLSESIVDELERVTVATGDGREQGNGKFKQNTQSVLKNSPVEQRAFKGKPVQIKAEEHNGYDREAAPSVKTAEKRQNVKAKSTDGRAAVKKEGDSAAILNKLSADPAGQKSLLGSKK